MHSKYDNMHRNIMFYALICINNHVIANISCMLFDKFFMERLLVPIYFAALSMDLNKVHVTYL